MTVLLSIRVLGSVIRTSSPFNPAPLYFFATARTRLMRAIRAVVQSPLQISSLFRSNNTIRRGWFTSHFSSYRLSSHVRRFRPVTCMIPLPMGSMTYQSVCAQNSKQEHVAYSLHPCKKMCKWNVEHVQWNVATWNVATCSIPFAHLLTEDVTVVWFNFFAFDLHKGSFYP